MESRRLETQFTQDVRLNYLLHVPEGDGPHPLMVFLHGAGERGDDLSLVKKHGPLKMVESGMDLPFIIAAPQCPAGTWWQINALKALLDELERMPSVDKRRAYLTGLSMGGAGTWGFADACPGRFAAIAPVCGPFVWLNAENFVKLPTWCFHGAMDPTVSVGDSVRMIRMIRTAGGEPRFTVYPNALHDSWSETYANRELYDWFLEHVLP